MNTSPKPVRSLREQEKVVLAEGKEWMQERLQQKLQQQADRTGRVVLSTNAAVVRGNAANTPSVLISLQRVPIQTRHPRACV